MTIESLLLIIVGLLFGFSIRLPFAFFRASDGFGEYSKLIALSQKRWIDYKIPDAANPGTFPRPSLVHFFISRFPKSIWRPVAILFNISADLTIAVFLYFLTPALLGNLIELTPSTAQSAGFLSMMVFLSTPILLPITARLKATNGRAISLLMTTAYFFSLWHGMEVHLWIGGVIAFILAYLIFLTSTFASQVILFFSIPMSVLYLNATPLLIPLTVLTLGYFLPFTGIRSLLIFKYWHTQFFASVFLKTRVGQRNLFANIFKFFVQLKTNLIEAKNLLMLDTPLFILLYSVPGLWLLFSNWMGQGWLPWYWQEPLAKFLWIILFSSGVVFVATATGIGRIFGEAERYFEYSSPMVTMLIVVLTFTYQSNPVLMLLALIFLQISVVVLVHTFEDSSRITRLIRYEPAIHSRSVKDLIDYLLNLKGDIRIITLPDKFCRLLSSQTLEPSQGRIKYYYRMMLTHQSFKNGMENYFRDSSTASSFDISPSEMNRHYGINRVVVEKKFLEKDKGVFSQALNAFPVVFENDVFSVYEIKATPN